MQYRPPGLRFRSCTEMPNLFLSEHPYFPRKRRRLVNKPVCSILYFGQNLIMHIAYKCHYHFSFQAQVLLLNSIVMPVSVTQTVFYVSFSF
jgi:hypothetical protein